MKKLFRVIILIVVLFGTVGLAWNHVVWAANSWETTDQAALSQIEESVSPDKDDDCDNHRNEDKNRCKDKEKEKDKCKKNPKHCGSVQPPPRRIVISETGEYSVGGFCTLSTVWNDPNIRLDASIMAPLPRELPEDVQKVRQGCLLDYFSTDERINELPGNSGNTTICFAATPGKSITVYFYDKYAPQLRWVALETTVDAGKACAPANVSGVYVATFDQH
jgi:hypothetical protein